MSALRKSSLKSASGTQPPWKGEDLIETAKSFRGIMGTRMKALPQILELGNKTIARIMTNPTLLSRWVNQPGQMPKDLKALDLAPDDLLTCRRVLETELHLRFEEDWAWTAALPRSARQVLNRRLQRAIEQALLYWWEKPAQVQTIIREGKDNPYPLMAACLHNLPIKPETLMALCDDIAMVKPSRLDPDRVRAAAIGAMAIGERNGRWVHVLVRGKTGKHAPGPGKFLEDIARLLEPDKVQVKEVRDRLFRNETWRKLLPITPNHSRLTDTVQKDMIEKMYPCWPLAVQIIASRSERGGVTCTPKWMDFSRGRAAGNLRDRLMAPALLVPESIEQAIQKARINGRPLDELQKQALLQIFTSPISIITGKPGTGKTALCRVLAEIADNHNMEVRGYAPTGRAAKRLEIASGISSRTIHSSLLFGGHSWMGAMARSNDGTPIDIAVVDESSMLDTRMTDAVFTGARNGTVRLVLIGDPDQLPPVEGRKYFHSIIEMLAERDLVTHLTVVHRHDERTLNAGIIHDPAKKWRWGGTVLKAECSPMTRLDIPGEQDRSPRYDGLPDDLRDFVVQWVKERQGKDWQILAFTNNLVKLLNETVRLAVTGTSKPAFVAGDRIKQKVNDYDTDLRNGEQGIVIRQSPDGKTVSAQFEDGRTVQVSREYAVLNWEFAWASTIHSAQGGQWDDILLLLPSCDIHNPSINQEALYTAITRVAEGAVTILSDQPDLVVQAARKRRARQESSFRSLLEKMLRGNGEPKPAGPVQRDIRPVPIR